MTNLEKVLKDLGTLIDYWDDVDRFEEHVYGSNILNTLTDARTWIEDTLKEREAQPAIIEGSDVIRIGRCPSCKAVLQPWGANYCYNCGKAVKWE